MRNHPSPPGPGGTGDPVERLLAESRRCPLLTAAEERALSQRIERGDRRARERMVVSNIRLVVSIARRYQGRGVPLADLVQEGMVGLIHAVDRFDWRPGFRFSTYGSIWIRKHVQTLVDSSGGSVRMPATLLRRTRRVAAAEAELAARLGRSPSDLELAEASGLTPEQLRDVRIACLPPVALDGPAAAGGATVGDLLAADQPSIEAELTASCQVDVLARAISSLRPMERQVLRLRFAAGDSDPATFAQIGAAVGLSAERARQIEDRALRHLARRPEITAMSDGRAPAVTSFQGMGAQAWTARALEELRASGMRKHRSGPVGRDALTPQEQQIAGLAAEGLSNREIAQRLFLSPRTVGSHLYRSYPKLGITSRVQLAAALAHVGVSA